jgi:prepilin-type N-terminal cleavage/methylation domain-containing protein
MKSRSGFTLVELLIVVIIIAILATVTLVIYAAQQRDANDNTRKGNVTVISEALEKYYDNNHEYPSVRDLVNNYAGNTGSVVAAKLSIDATDLVMPNMSGTNALSSTTASSSNDYITYSGPSDSSCQTTVGGGCQEYTLKYVEESSGNTITIDSRHQI